MCFEEEGVRHEVKTRTENWPLDPGRRKLLETLTQNELGAVMTMMSKDCVWCVVAGTADGVSLSPPLAGVLEHLAQYHYYIILSSTDHCTYFFDIKIS